MKKRISRIIGVGVTLALLTSLLVMALPASALSQPTVALGAYPNSMISYAGADYTILFTLGKDLEAGDIITITFPTGTTVATQTAPTNGTSGNVTGTVTMSPGWISGNWTSTVSSAATTWKSSGTTRTVTLTVGSGDTYGEGSTVRVFIGTGITNPSSPGDYTLTVATTDEPTAVTSVAYTIISPIILPGPGTVEVYNPAGILMGSYVGLTNIQDAIDHAGSGYTVKVGPGSYDQTVNVNQQITLVSTGGAASTVIGDIDSGGSGGAVTVNASGTTTYPVVIDGFTIKGAATAGTALTINGDKVTVQNCIFSRAGASTSTFAQTMVSYANGAPVYGGTISNCSFDTTLGAVNDVGIAVTANGLIISGCTFTLDMTAAYVQDIAINTSAGSTTLPVTITGCTITGASGVGVMVTGGIANITTSSLSGLWNALFISSGTTTVTESTVSGSGVAASTTMPLGAAAVDISGGIVTIRNSEVSGSPSYAFIVGSGVTSTNINIMFNKITNNVKNIYTAASGAGINATHNWWGAATGPATGTIVGLSPTTNLVDSSGYLGASASGTFTMASASLLTRTSIGVDVTATANAGKPAPAMIGVANYATNPQGATPDPALAGGFYDVYVKEATVGDQASVLLKFYNAAITANTKVYVWSTLRGNWAQCVPTTSGAAATQGVNLFGGYAWVTVTGTTIPAITDLAGTPFALVEPAAPTELSVSVTKPTFGAQDVSIKPTFTWTVAGDATGYEFVLAEELGLDDPFQIIDYSATSTTNGHVAREDLKYSTTYWWRVRANSATATGDWVTSFFTTEAEPEEAPPPIVVEEKETPAPVITVEIPPAVEKVTQAIPDWALYTIIAVGAVLIIAVIVLIVRTRRVA
jgi:hypothetical protein